MDVHACSCAYVHVCTMYVCVMHIHMCIFFCCECCVHFGTGVLGTSACAGIYVIQVFF